MPYIITTTPRSPTSGILVPQSATRRAVATLDEAREAVYIIARDAMGVAVAPIARRDANAIPSTGGTLNAWGGTVIEVAPIRWDDLRERAWAAGAASPIERSPGDNGRPIIDAFNALQ